jgi:putative ABC transport system permease protein
MFSLAVRQLVQNRKRTLITLIGIILSVSMVTAVTGFVVSTRDMMRLTYIAHSGDYHTAVYPVTAGQAAAVAADSRVESSYTQPHETDGRTVLFFRLENAKRDYAQVSETIAADHGIEEEWFSYNQELLAVEGVVAADASLMTMYGTAAVLGAIIMLGSIIVIANAFYISASERTQQFGVLKSAGATKEQIRWTVLAEGFALSVIAIPLGIAVGFGVEAIALAIANSFLLELSALNEGMFHLRVLFSGWAIAGTVAISLVTVFLSAWVPAGRAAKITAIEAISRATDIAVRPREVKTSPLVAKLFGFEGSLAAKALKRSRGKYRATVISLVVSVALFILGSGFGDMVTVATDIIYRDFGINVIMQAREVDAASISAITDGLAELPGELSATKFIYADAEVSGDILTPDARRYWEGPAMESALNPGSNIRLIALSDNEFVKLCELAGITPEAVTTASLQGILVNYDVAEGAGRRAIYRPFEYESGMSLNVTVPDGSVQALELVAAADNITTGIAPYTNSYKMNIVLPASAVEGLAGDAPYSQVYWVANAEDSGVYTDLAYDVFESVWPEGRYTVLDYDQNARFMRSISMLMMVFVYGFIGMLSLIAVTSVLGTISTNINLRLPEFAMLSSVGMTPGGLRRMLNLESLFYGLKALIIGLPVSLALYWLLYMMINASIGFDFTLPWMSMAVSSAAVMLITFATMGYSTRAMKGKNTVELIRKMNI